MTPTSRSVFLLWLCALVPVASGLAQDVAAAQASFGLVAVDGKTLALGPDYRARLDAAGVTFEPALGQRASETQHWSYEWQSVRRGAVTVMARGAAAADPEVGPTAVRYERAPGMTEVYEARRDGLEQSFVFAARPAGTGDLVVRGRVRSSLPLQSQGEVEGLHYELPGIGGVRVGAVTGVDANGATAAGTVRLLGDMVEYTLPAAFVDHAAYPLVLDPLVGTAFAIGSTGAGVDTMPRVAYDAAAQVYLVVWTVVVSATSAEVRGQRVSVSGALLGSVAVLTTNVHLTEPAVVVNIRSTGRFLVAWVTPFTGMAQWMMGRSVQASSGSVSTTVTLQFHNGSNMRLAAGGDLRTVGDSALLAYAFHPAGNQVQAARVQVPASGVPAVLGTPVTLAIGGTGASEFSDVAVSTTAGSAGRWLVTWVQNGVTVFGAAVSDGGTICVPATTLYSTGLFTTVPSLACATSDGDHFVVALHTSAPLASAETLRARPVTVIGVCPSTLSLGAPTVVATGTGGDSRPAIDFARDKYLVAWRRLGGGGVFEVALKGIDPATCVDCGVDYALEPGAGAQEWPALAARFSGGDATNDQGMAVWTNGTIRGRRVEATGNGSVVNLGGACGGAPGTNVASYVGSPVIGNLDFQLAISSPSAPVLAVVIGLSNLSIPCGPCTLVPTADILMTGAGPAPLPLPCDLSYLGVTFYTQWLTLQPGGCPVLPDFGLSNALQFTIGE